MGGPDCLRAQIGIATGVVIVGDLIGQGEAQERLIVGEAPDLAVKLQALADPNAIVIADSTSAHVGELFVVEPLASKSPVGANSPRMWQVIGECRGLGRFEALHPAVAPLVGRDDEFALLLRRWEKAKTGEGKVLLLSGEPGVGKSRLSAALEDRLQAEPHFLLRYSCSSHYQDSAFYPIIAQLERAAGFGRADTPDTRLDRLEALIAAGAPADEDVALLAGLLSLPGSGHYSALDLDPRRRREKTFEALLRQFENLAQREPVLIVFEDLQWIDATSRELLDNVVQRIEAWRALLIATFRPEFHPPWTGLPQVIEVPLNRLNRRNSAALVQLLSSKKAALSSHVIDEIVARGDGIPLFLEELTKEVLDAGDKAAGTSSGAPGSAPSVPATLQASLMARLDRLGPAAKELAQVGAAIGREFSFELLAAVASHDVALLRDAMASLVETGILFQRGTPPDAMFLFKHALVQDVAYNTSLGARLQPLHGRIADALLLVSGGRPAAAPEIIAHHLQIAGRTLEAIAYWRKAGEQSARRAANHEAVAQLRRALALIDKQPEAPERWRSELAVLEQLGPALINSTARSSPEAGEAADRAVALAQRLESSADLARSMGILWNFNLHRGRLERASEIAVGLEKIARELDDHEILLEAHHAAWTADWLRCRLAEGRAHIDAGMALYDADRQAHHRYLYVGHDPGACALSIDAHFQMLLGYPEHAKRCEARAIELARRLEHVPSLAQALGQVCEAQVLRRDLPSVIATAKELLELSEEYGIVRQRHNALIFRGWALAQSGTAMDGIALLKETLEFRSQSGARLAETRTLGFIGECLLAAGRYAEAIEYVDRALQVASEIGELRFVPQLHQLRGELLMRTHTDEAEAAGESLKRAIAVARELGTKHWELRAAISLARLRADQGRRAEARDLLAPVYGWFTEGFDTADLKDAKSLLDEFT